MTIKPQNDGMYGSNNSIIFFLHLSGRLVSWVGQDAFLGGAKRPVLKQLVLESNLEVFF